MAVAVLRVRAARPSVADWVTWLAAHRELAWMLALVGAAAVAHAWNMFEFPYYEDDEGTYLAQAWSVFHLGQLAPYTYWYDHPPLGWIQLGLLSSLTGGFNALGNSVATGRLFMLLYQVGSTAILYRVARGSGRSIMAASVAVLAFSLSAYGLYFHRRVLLDNIAAFWMLAALLPLVAPRISLTRVWISAIALGIGILSKEIDVVVIPAIAMLVVYRSDGSQRWIAAVGWTALVTVFGSLWLLLAILKGELLPGGVSEHVSLVGTLAAQAARDPDGGLLQVGSGFWQRAIAWAEEDPLLVIVGTCTAIAAALTIRRRPVPGLFAMMAISLWLFLGRGGATLPFYLVPVEPLLALQLALLVDVIRPLVRPAPARWRRLGGVRRHGTPFLVGAVVAMSTLVAYTSRPLAFENSPTQLWVNRPGAAQRAAVAWIRDTVPAESGIVIDMYAWLDLQAPVTAPRYELANYYWKLDRDPEIRDGVFGNDWHRIDYLMVTPQVQGDAGTLPFLKSALDHADILASFGDGDWPVTIERTRVPQTVAIPADTLLGRQWTEWSSAFLQGGHVSAPATNGPTADLQAMAMLEAVYMDDQRTFDAVWGWTKEHQRSATGLLSAEAGGKVAANPGTQADAATALVFAADRWHDDSDRRDGRALIDEIWRRETRPVGDDRLVVADPPVDQNGRFLVDLSGLSPNAYRVFAAVDPANEWSSVVDGTYAFVQRVTAAPDLGGRAGIVPRWAGVDPTTGAAIAIRPKADGENLFDGEASRLGWRIGLDWLWNRDPRARTLLRDLSLPRRELAAKSWLGRAYHLDGNPIDGSNTLATYTTALPSVLFGGAPELASSTFTKDVLAPVVGSKPPDPGDALGRSWAWFATALMDGSLVDLTRTSGLVDWSTVPGLTERVTPPGGLSESADGPR